MMNLGREENCRGDIGLFADLDTLYMKDASFLLETLFKIYSRFRFVRVRDETIVP